MLTPRENLKLSGHQEEKDFFLNAFHSSRFAHAWILGGAFGIGKATFAFHLARYIVSGRQDRNTTFLESDPLHRRMVAQSHENVWTVEVEEGSEIGVEVVRGITTFLNKTSGEGEWRVIIIDEAEKLNRNAANALLKRLEEPPPRTVFLLVTHTPGRLLSTLRSRCQLLTLRPLREEEVKSILQFQGMKIPDFFSLAQGSPGRLMRLMEGDGPQIYADLQKILGGATASSFIHSYGGDETSYALIEDFLRIFLYKSLMEKIKKKPSFFTDMSLEQALRVYEKVDNLLTQCQVAQLDKRATLSCVFSHLNDR